MKIIDLTHLIEEDMPVFPGTEKPILKNACTLEAHGFREKLITMFSHTGTHMDSPAHMLNGWTLDDFDVDQFMGPVTVIAATDYVVSMASLKQHERDIQKSDFVLIRTGWDRLWGSQDYFKGFPALSPEAANYLTQFNLKGYGIDAISVDHMENSDFTIHHILLEKNMVMIENLRNLDQVQTGDLLSVLPLNIKDADGAPIRAVAIRIDDQKSGATRS